MELTEILRQAVMQNASDIFLVAGLPLSYKVNGRILEQETEKLLPPDTEQLITGIYRLADNRDMGKLIEHGDDDFSFSVVGLSRFRVSTYKRCV